MTRERTKKQFGKYFEQKKIEIYRIPYILDIPYRKDIILDKRTIKQVFCIP